MAAFAPGTDHAVLYGAGPRRGARLQPAYDEILVNMVYEREVKEEKHMKLSKRKDAMKMITTMTIGLNTSLGVPMIKLEFNLISSIGT